MPSYDNSDHDPPVSTSAFIAGETPIIPLSGAHFQVAHQAPVPYLHGPKEQRHQPQPCVNNGEDRHQLPVVSESSLPPQEPSPSTYAHQNGLRLLKLVWGAPLGAFCLWTSPACISHFYEFSAPWSVSCVENVKQNLTLGR